MSAQREVEIEATPQEVWDSLVDEEKRERWLEPDADREVRIEVAEEPERLVWTWQPGNEEPATRVEFRIVAVPDGARVVVTESAPAFPLSMFAASFALVAA